MLYTSFPSSIGKVTAWWASKEKCSVLLSSTRRKLCQFEGIRVDENINLSLCSRSSLFPPCTLYGIFPIHIRNDVDSACCSSCLRMNGWNTISKYFASKVRLGQIPRKPAILNFCRQTRVKFGKHTPFDENYALNTKKLFTRPDFEF